MATNANGNSMVKSIGTILVVIVGFMSISREYRQKLEFAERHHTQQISSIRQELNVISDKMSKDDEREIRDSAKYSSLTEKVLGIQTQFDGVVQVTDDLKEHLIKVEDWQTWWYRNIHPTKAQQNEKIKNLEQNMKTIK